ncbi:M81 family metallopeptidase [Denitromonas ohlonensis]|uniref:Microcystinase C n=2 Tax=Denitromonas TaxID=139331 RepID=A0A557SQK3_9RHOO|nr:M81 family metallopeptidase [Denitromonas ohlonensis]TVO66824.1 M81 family metallopeptidase [Denitromonas ohlonensis]TVO79694.1 M81 family metallopeptidase [Denitromonas ohlonensis]
MAFKVLTAEVSHETNTFSVRQTDADAFRDRFFLLGETALVERAHANTELAGVLDVGRAHDWTVRHVLSVAAGPSGLVKRAAFDSFAAPIMQRAAEAPFDGVILCLHGAMVTDFCEDGEGELLRQLRAAIGMTVPVAITLDPHANVTRQMCALADIIVSFKTYPHVDMRDTGRHAATILHRTMSGEIRPRTIMARVPMLEEVNGGRTDVGPMIARLARARAYETRDDVFAVSINAGFASADIAEVGPTVLVTGQGEVDAHMAFAQGLANDMWVRRHESLNTYLSVKDAAKLAREFPAGEGLLVIADYADNPGAGAYGDSTALLAALLDADVDDAAFGPMVDSEAVKLLCAASVGQPVRLALGGKTNPRFGGGPLQLEGTLVSVWDGKFVGDGPILGGLSASFGRSAVIRVKGVEILVVTLARQILDVQQFKAFGIDPAQKRVVALKSMQHFRAAFESIAGRIIVCDSGALCTPDYRALPYRRVRRPIFPLDDFDD